MSIQILWEYRQLVSVGLKPVGMITFRRDYIERTRRHFDALESRPNAILFKVERGPDKVLYGYARNETMRDLFLTILTYRDKCEWPERESSQLRGSSTEWLISALEGLVFGYGPDDIHRFIEDKVHGRRGDDDERLTGQGNRA